MALAFSEERRTAEARRRRVAAPAGLPTLQGRLAAHNKQLEEELQKTKVAEQRIAEVQKKIAAAKLESALRQSLTKLVHDLPNDLYISRVSTGVTKTMYGDYTMVYVADMIGKLGLIMQSANFHQRSEIDDLFPSALVLMKWFHLKLGHLLDE